MKKETNTMHGGKYTSDAIIKRGYDIYDEWVSKKLSSRRIVKAVESTISAAKESQTNSVKTEALSYLFALDTRIN